MRLTAGNPQQLGATVGGGGTNFAIFSADAEKVELCLFESDGIKEHARIALPERTDDIWHGHIADIAPGQLYGYRIHGPYEPTQGYRFNPNKLLLDPYAKELAGRFTPSELHYGYQFGNARADLSFCRRDNAGMMPKCTVVGQTTMERPPPRPRVAWEDTIIYEAHVKGLTQQRADIPTELRGTFRALATLAMINHLKRLGVTSLELLPIHTFIDEPFLVRRGLTNYWGYNTLNFFTADARYGDTPALRETITRLHDAGIEVILDVVYNHTAEGDHLGQTLSFRGIDNRSYYWLKEGQPRFYENFTGCGNALNLVHPRMLALVVDSLRFWVESCGVDGFRFDLATTLARGPYGFDGHSPFFATIRRDPVLANIKLIAEPWDIGHDGYRVGGFPPLWSEWNDQFRRSMRRHWTGEGSWIGEIAARMTGSADIFEHGERTPRASINHVTVHDGFTLADLVSYERKHNEANGESNRDGADYNQSTNCGAEGPTNDAGILGLRRQIRRNFLASLLLAQGVPLLLAGDEVGNSQGGNNNAYCQDNAIGWVDWAGLGGAEDLSTFVAQLSDLRRRYPQLRGRGWLKGRRADGSYDVLWLTPSATEMMEQDWNFPNGRFLSYVLAPVEPASPPLYIVLNAAPEAIAFTLPSVPGYDAWSLVLNTAIATDSGTVFGAATQHTAFGRSVLVFSAAPQAS